MRPQVAQGKYIYCIVKSELPLNNNLRGIDEREVHTIHFRDLAVVVSDLRTSTRDLGQYSASVHKAVVRDITRKLEALPVRFGTVARSNDDIVEGLLQRRYAEFHDRLNYLADKVELRLKVLWKREIMFAEVIASAPKLQVLRDTLVRFTDEDSDHQRIQLAQMVEEAIIRKRDEQSSRVLNALRPIAVESKVAKTTADNVVLNVTFLVEKQRQGAFDTSVQELAARNAGWLTFKYSGPIPPLDFGIIAVCWDDKT